MIKCPVCRAPYRPAETREQKVEPKVHPLPTPPLLHLCRRCGADLSSLIHLHDQAVWYHRQAVQASKAGEYSAAMDWNDQALALHADNANFHALAAQLWALKGEFKRAIASLKMAQQLNPKHPTVSTLMECLQHQ